jgi:hypothetical protein
VSIAQDPEGGTTVTEALGPEIGFGDLGTPPFAAANAAWEGAYFPAVLRAGAAWDTGRRHRRGGGERGAPPGRARA